MRSAQPPSDVRDIGVLGDDIAPFLYRLRGGAWTAFRGRRPGPSLDRAKRRRPDGRSRQAPRHARHPHPASRRRLLISHRLGGDAARARSLRHRRESLGRLAARLRRARERSPSAPARADRPAPGLPGAGARTARSWSRLTRRSSAMQCSRAPERDPQDIGLFNVRRDGAATSRQALRLLWTPLPRTRKSRRPSRPEPRTDSSRACSCGGCSMSDPVVVDLFVEDRAHEEFLKPLLHRVAREEERRGRSCRCGPHGAGTGAPSRSSSFTRPSSRGALSVHPRPDLVIVGIDGNCTTFAKKRTEIEDATQAPFGSGSSRRVPIRTWSAGTWPIR